jgi:hypothetical protein
MMDRIAAGFARRYSKVFTPPELRLDVYGRPDLPVVRGEG